MRSILMALAHAFIGRRTRQSISMVFASSTERGDFINLPQLINLSCVNGGDTTLSKQYILHFCAHTHTHIVPRSLSLYHIPFHASTYIRTKHLPKLKCTGQFPAFVSVLCRKINSLCVRYILAFQRGGWGGNELIWHVPHLGRPHIYSRVNRHKLCV